jgi:hypothetical protein
MGLHYTPYYHFPSRYYDSIMPCTGIVTTSLVRFFEVRRQTRTEANLVKGKRPSLLKADTYSDDMPFHVSV